MKIFNRTVFRIPLIFVFIVGQISGCTTFAGLKERRDLPKSTETITYDSKNQAFWYDKSVRAYRPMPKDKQNGHPRLEPVVRDQLAKKVQREEELIASSDAQAGKVLGTGAKVTTGTGLVVASGIAIAQFFLFLPCVLAFSVAGGVLGLPSLVISTQLDTTYIEEAQRAYVQGREKFAAGSFESALTSWDYAEQVMPSLQALSDVNFWRGQTFDALNEPRAAALAYATFLGYSESSLPSYFKTDFPDDHTWEWKADQAEARIAEMSGRTLGVGASAASQP